MNRTKADYEKLFATNQLALESAILAIYERQTADEKAVRDTRVLNHVGFTAADAKRLSRNGAWIQKNRARLGAGRCSQTFLDPRYVAVARQLMPKYWKQLNDVLAAKSGS